MKLDKYNVAIISLSIVLVLLMFGIVKNQIEYNNWKQQSKGLTQVGSVTYTDYEMNSYTFMCKICDEQCERGREEYCGFCKRF